MPPAKPAKKAAPKPAAKKAAPKPAAKKAAAAKTPEEQEGTQSAPPAPHPVPEQPPVERATPSGVVVEDEAPAVGSAAWQRADYVRALNEELEMCEAQGKDARVKDIKAELSRVKSVKSRTPSPRDQA